MAQDRHSAQLLRSDGCEPWQGDPLSSQLQHGLQWPAESDNQDCLVSKGLWIGTTDYQRDGLFSATQHLGVVTLHADKSPFDRSDDLYQSRTTQYIDSDAEINLHNDPFDSAGMAVAAVLRIVLSTIDGAADGPPRCRGLSPPLRRRRHYPC